MSALQASIGVLCPEFIVALGAMALMMLGVFMGERSQRLISFLAVALFIMAAVAVLSGEPGRAVAFNGAFVAAPAKLDAWYSTADESHSMMEPRRILSGRGSRKSYPRGGKRVRCAWNCTMAR